MKEIRLEVPEATFDQLARIANDRQTVADVILVAIEARLAQQGPSGSHSILDIVGIAEGERDLSQDIDTILYGPSVCR